MRNITRVGVDFKNVIQVHAVDAAGKGGLEPRSSEKFLWCADLPAGCLVAMEACSGAHHWCRQLRERGFDARTIPAQFRRAVPDPGQERQERGQRCRCRSARPLRDRT